jgi:hypothetical protein
MSIAFPRVEREAFWRNGGTNPTRESAMISVRAFGRHRTFRQSRSKVRHPEVRAFSRASKDERPRWQSLLIAGRYPGPSPFEARAIARQDARERAFTALTPQGDGTKYERASMMHVGRPSTAASAFWPSRANGGKFNDYSSRASGARQTALTHRARLACSRRANRPSGSPP